MSKKTKDAAVAKELNALQREDGSWSPEDVVEYARQNKKSALHNRFDWNVEEAAMEHWLLVARHLIKHIVIIEPRSRDVTIGQLVSVPSRRGGDKGSFITMATLSNNEEWRLEVLEEITSKLKTMKSHYASVLPELDPVWRAIKRST